MCLPGRQPSNFYVCVGIQNIPESEAKIHWQFLVLQLLSALAHVITNIMIKLYDGEDGAVSKFKLADFRKKFSLSFIETRTISDLASTLVGLAFFCLVAVITTILNRKGLHNNYDLLIMYFFNILYPCFVSIVLFSMYYLRHKPLRKALLRESKNTKTVVEPIYICEN